MATQPRRRTPDGLDRYLRRVEQAIDGSALPDGLEPRSAAIWALRWRNWAADAEGITGDALLSFVDNELFPTLKSLSADPVRNPRGFVVRGVFEVGGCERATR